MTNSERRISRVRAAVPAPGEARADWAIAADFARRLAAGSPGASATCFAFVDAEDAFNEHREATRGRDLDITGLSYALLENRGPQQWPFPKASRRPHTAYETDLSHRRRPRALRRRRPTSPRRRSVDARYPSASPPDACATSGTA